ncbi:DUF6884 domain-containing protein [Photobacterium leiognathi]|uniref:DUF6884 domain-containing protein n=1 Tax=Photobacterium leiognathi TaxID=553611 RepID=UPI0029819A16|nr:DUF6884 domain-containing protein [Photobacterium leiognathi]
MERDTLIIACSANKKEKPHLPFDLYLGQIYKLIRANTENIHDQFHVYILSAKYGLIDCDIHGEIAPYDSAITKETLDEFVIKNGEVIAEQFKALQGEKITIVLPKMYLKALELSLALNDLTLKDFALVDMPVKPRGIGDHQAFLKRKLNA